MRPGPPQPPDPSIHLQGLARRIRALRERRGLTQEDFAARCGISVSFASLLERGERSPSYETLLQVASALGLPPSELFRLEEEDDTG
jgi:transcriptional regulator with XRE-family HTH domain